MTHVTCFYSIYIIRYIEGSNKISVYSQSNGRFCHVSFLPSHLVSHDKVSYKFLFIPIYSCNCLYLLFFSYIKSIVMSEIRYNFLLNIVLSSFICIFLLVFYVTLNSNYHHYHIRITL